MFGQLERFSEIHQHTIALMEALSTFAAVVISLMLATLAQRSVRTRIKARAAVSEFIHSTLEGKRKEYVTVTVTNVGQMPAMLPLSFFQWQIPFRRGLWIMHPWDCTKHDPWLAQRIYPADVTPRSSEMFFLGEIARFRTTMAETFGEVRHARWRLRFTKAIVVTADSKVFKVRLNKEVRRILSTARRISKVHSIKPT
jgi:hypothetical protein